MENSPLIRLPPEIREHVYKLAFQKPWHLTIHLSSGRPKLSRPDGVRHHPLALAQACSQLRHESLPIFFGTNTFALETDHIETYHPGYGLRTSWLGILQQWLDVIGDGHRHQLRDVDFDLGQTVLNVPCSCESNQIIIETIWRSLEPALALFDERRTKVSLRCKTLCWNGPISRELRFSLKDAEAAKKDIEAFGLAVWKGSGLDRSTMLKGSEKYVQAGGVLDAEPQEDPGDALEFVRLIRQRNSVRGG